MKFFSFFSLYQKLLAGYLFLLAILILPCLFSIYSIYKIEATVSTFFKRTLELSSSIEYAKNLVPSLEAEARRLIILHKEDSLKAVKPLIADLEHRIDPLAVSDPPDLENNFKEFRNTLAMLKFLVSQPDILKEHQTGTQGVDITDEAREQEIKGLTYHLMELLKEAEAIQKRSLEQKSRESAEIISQVKNGTLLLLLLATIVALTVPWALYIYIKRPLGFLQKGIHAISKGDFDHQIPVVSRDELGELADSFNHMAHSLKELDTLKSDFIAVASHELKTPLAAMMEASKLLGEPQIGHLNERQKKLVTVLNTSMTRFKTLVEELLDLSKMQAGLVSLGKDNVDIREVVDSAVKEFSPIAAAKNVSILTEYPERDIHIEADGKRLKRALINLLDNALNFTDKGRDIKVVVQNADGKRGRKLQIIVVDAGPGIHKAEQKQVFEKFYQSRITPRQSGSGLGLTIARQIITAHGGEIWIQSPPETKYALEEGTGTAVFVQLPFQP